MSERPSVREAARTVLTLAEKRYAKPAMPQPRDREFERVCVRLAPLLAAEVERLTEALEGLAETADWYRRCLEGVIDRTPVRGLAEARAAYDAAYDTARAALAVSAADTETPA